MRPLERIVVSDTLQGGMLDLGAAEHVVGLVSRRKTLILVALVLYKVSMTVILDEEK